MEVELDGFYTRTLVPGETETICINEKPRTGDSIIRTFSSEAELVKEFHFIYLYQRSGESQLFEIFDDRLHIEKNKELCTFEGIPKDSPYVDPERGQFDVFMWV